MTNPDPSRSFETQIDIAAPRDLVWQAIATDEGLRRWFAPEASVEPRVGGEIVWAWKEHFHWAQRIEILEPGTRLRTRYDSPVDDGAGGKQPLFIDFLLEGEGGTTRLRLVQSGFGSGAGFDEEYDGISRGWPIELRSLRLYVEQHFGQDRRLAWCSADLDMKPDEAWRRLVGDEGFRCGEAVATLSEGAPFDFTTADGDRFAGKALRCHEHEFTADLESHGGAFFRLSVHHWGGKTHVWCWLAAYDRPAAELAEQQARWDARLATLFALNGESAAKAEA